jgi:hypothetical protein
MAYYVSATFVSVSPFHSEIVAYYCILDSSLSRSRSLFSLFSLFLDWYLIYSSPLTHIVFVCSNITCTISSVCFSLFVLFLVLSFVFVRFAFFLLFFMFVCIISDFLFHFILSCFTYSAFLSYFFFDSFSWMFFLPLPYYHQSYRVSY